MQDGLVERMEKSRSDGWVGGNKKRREERDKEEKKLIQCEKDR